MHNQDRYVLYLFIRQRVESHSRSNDWKHIYRTDDNIIQTENLQTLKWITNFPVDVVCHTCNLNNKNFLKSSIRSDYCYCTSYNNGAHGKLYIFYILALIWPAWLRVIRVLSDVCGAYRHIAYHIYLQLTGQRQNI